MLNCTSIYGTERKGKIMLAEERCSYASEISSKTRLLASNRALAFRAAGHARGASLPRPIFDPSREGG